MGLSLVSAALSVTIGGVAYPSAVVSSAVDVLAPYVDACEIEVPWGDVDISGSDSPAELLPAVGAAVAVACGGWTWRGLLTRRVRCGSGKVRGLRLSARGPGLALDRCYLPSFARSGVSGVVQMAGGPRFAPGTCSATAGGLAGTHYLVANGGDWTVRTALASYVAHINAHCGLPTITVDYGTADLDRVLPDIDLEVVSVHAGLQTILGHRLGVYWRLRLTAAGWVLSVHGYAGTGRQVDLTGGSVVDYELAEDASAALGSLEVRGARKVYAVSVDGKTAGTLASDWTGDDEAARAAGDRSSPAFRRFKLNDFALPDGSSSLTADLVQSLPIEADETLQAGGAPWLLFAQAADSSWLSLQGQVSIHAGGGRIWIEGIDPTAWASWLRLRLTLALSPRAHITTLRTGGSGLGRGLAVVSTQHAYAGGATVRVSGSSLSTVTGAVADDSDPVEDEADALWSSLSGPQLEAVWTVEGVDGPEPGDRITSFLLPVPGGTPTQVDCDCLCTAVRRTRSGGRVRSAFEVSVLPYSKGAMIP